ncbi:hypothetical protein H310_14153 [Aphanomyces invadans]|uniref:Anaphase-promoting complex subunit 4 WD40 domain-containing protein n=1 Tax=Aphanomyces invadans TaxID=157072 RepID=A0A024TC14_9STRA|nr:hypothetical protein H310_14153 [Aphanomyces invadans]ETV91141.1 hypothetical protein H310_14153 [Aphanomyces invadans]|eukprot:XP_008880172.1 hypothetical protein H310_14153 [Aphanomyces invadans]
MTSPIALTWGENGNGRSRQAEQPSWGRVQSPTPTDSTDIGPIAAMACTGWGIHALNQNGDSGFGMHWTNVPFKRRGRECRCQSPVAYLWTYVPNAYSSAKFTLQVINCTPTEDCHVKAEIITAGWSLVALLLADGSIKTCHIHCITQTKVYSIASDSRDPIERMVAGSGFSVALSNLGLVYLWHEIGQSESLHFDTDDKLGLRGGRFSHVSARLHNLALVDGATGRLRMFDLNRGREITSTWMDSTLKIAKVSHGNLNGGALLTNVQVWRRGNGS